MINATPGQTQISRRTFSQAAVGAFAASFVAGTAAGASNEQGELDDLMRPFIGGVVLVKRQDTILCRRAYGIADSSNGHRCTPTSVFRIASLSKAFTSALVLMLWQSGKLNLDASVKQWFPSLPDYARAITIRQLLKHTSGIPDYEQLVPETLSFYLNAQNILEIISAAREPLFEPGTRFHYSNSGYCLLALIVESVTGDRFDNALRHYLFKPLGMNNSVLLRPGQTLVRDRAIGHVATASGFMTADSSPASFTEGDGGIYSTVDDLSRWDRALYSSYPLKPAARELAFTPNGLSIGAPPLGSYGMGWAVRAPAKHTCVGGTGHTLGFSSALMRYMRARATVIVLLNQDEVETAALAASVADIFRIPRD